MWFLFHQCRYVYLNILKDCIHFNSIHFKSDWYLKVSAVNKAGNKTPDSNIACLTCNASISPRVLAARRKIWNHQRQSSLPSVFTLRSILLPISQWPWLSLRLLRTPWLPAFTASFYLMERRLRHPQLVLMSKPLFQSFSPILGRFLAHLILILCPCLLVQKRDWIFILIDPIESIRH